jgi:hypothetical protein
VAIALGSSLGSNKSKVSSTTIVLTTAASVAAGGFIVVGVGYFHASATVSLSGGGLTWATDKTGNNGSVRSSVFSAQAPAGLASGTAITATFSVAVNVQGIGGYSFSGIATSAPLDATASATPTAGTAWNCGGVATLNASDIVLGWAMGDAATATTSTATGPFAELLDFAETTGGGETWTLVYQIVSSTGTYTPSGTWALSQTNVGLGVAYMDAASVPASPSMRPTFNAIPFIGGGL